MIINKKVKPNHIAERLNGELSTKCIKEFLLKKMEVFPKGTVFTLKDLVGGENWNWDNSPLIILYQYYIENNRHKEEAFRLAAIDAEKLLASALSEDKDKYEFLAEYPVNAYRKV